jgi:hypothetical protein
MAVRIAEVHCAQDARGRAQGRAHVALLDVHVVGVGQHHAGGPDRRDQLRRLRDGVDHVVLVAVERLEEQHDTSRRRMAADLGEALQQDLPVLLGCARRVLERRKPAGEHAPCRWGDHAQAAQRGDAVELAAQALDRSPPLRGIEVTQPAAQGRACGREARAVTLQRLQLGDAPGSASSSSSPSKPAALAAWSRSASVSPGGSCSWMTSGGAGTATPRRRAGQAARRRWPARARAPVRASSPRPRPRGVPGGS